MHQNCWGNEDDAYDEDYSDDGNNGNDGNDDYDDDGGDDADDVNDNADDDAYGGDDDDWYFEASTVGRQSKFNQDSTIFKFELSRQIIFILQHLKLKANNLPVFPL